MRLKRILGVVLGLGLFAASGTAMAAPRHERAERRTHEQTFERRPVQRIYAREDLNRDGVITRAERRWARRRTRFRVRRHIWFR